MATFRKRLTSQGETKWQAQIVRKGHAITCKTFNNEKDAIKWARDKESEMDRGTYVNRSAAENTTLLQALERYEREVIPSHKGARQEFARVKYWKTQDIAKRSMSSIKRSELKELKTLRLREVSADTVRLDFALLSQVFTTAIEDWEIGGILHPLYTPRGLRRKKEMKPKSRTRRLLAGEWERIVTVAGSPLIIAIASFAIATAMRRSEIAGMTWDSVDLKKRRVTLNDTKNGTTRHVSLSLPAKEILEKLPRPIFSKGSVWGMKPDSITRAWNRAVEEARAMYEKESLATGKHPESDFLIDLRFHDLRHEATSRLFERRPMLHIMEIAAITGHKDLMMLQRYTHLQSDKIISRLDESEVRV
jgi:integrase